MLPGALTAGTPPPVYSSSAIVLIPLSAGSSLQGSSPSWVVSGESLPFQKVSVSSSVQWEPANSRGQQGDSAALGVGTVQFFRVQVGTMLWQGHREVGPGSGEELKPRTRWQAAWASPRHHQPQPPACDLAASQALIFSRCPERRLGQCKRHICAGQLECWHSDQC